MFYVKWADNIGARSRRLLRNTGEFARAKIFVRGVSTIKNKEFQRRVAFVHRSRHRTMKEGWRARAIKGHRERTRAWNGERLETKREAVRGKFFENANLFRKGLAGGPRSFTNAPTKWILIDFFLHSQPTSPVCAKAWQGFSNFHPLNRE